MDRIYASGAAGNAPSVPASPSSGYPTAGNPSTGTPATKPGPYWYHMITEELIGVIVAAGLTPSGGTLTQLKAALDALYGAAASATEIANFSAVNKFIRPDRLASAFTSSLAANGYVKLPGGVILQWGTVATPAANSTTAVTFPIAFPTACRFVGISGVAGSVTNSSSDGGAYPSSFTTTGFTLGNYWDGAVSPATQYWFAIGH